MRRHSRRHAFHARPRARAIAHTAPSLPLRMVLLSILVCLVLGYIFFMNAMTQKSFALKRLGTLVAERAQEGKRLEVNLAERESMANLAERIAALGMIPTERVEFVNGVSGAVALR